VALGEITDLFPKDHEWGDENIGIRWDTGGEHFLPARLHFDVEVSIGEG